MTKKTHFFSRAFTIIESLVVLGILFVLTMVIIALVKYANSPVDQPENEGGSAMMIYSNPLPRVI
ncbi:MAG: type II secretion system protein [Verrucomicrobiales bacterium]|nr:type II secretion system protein [Verrucomicrobiales bacterium]